MALQSSCNSSYCNIDAKHKGVCPTGWHIPSDAEWSTLTIFVGTNPGTKLKAKSGWSEDNGTDEFGFSALPGGYGYSDGSFYGAGNFGYWWSATNGASYAWDRTMYFNDADVNRDGHGKAYLSSVRCVQD
jgi:uncharacterized protein (TIGR02145 family)